MPRPSPWSIIRSQATCSPVCVMRPPVPRSIGRSPDGWACSWWPKPPATSAPSRAPITTPLEPFEGTRLVEGLVAIPVLRAGLGLLEAVTELYPDAVVGYLGMERDEDTHEPRDYYAKLPPMQGRRALVVDPMLATGGSGSAAVTYVKEAGATDIVFVCVVAAPEGLARMQADHPDVPVVSAALDRQLNEHAYILPGLGDFGDRLYGTL